MRRELEERYGVAVVCNVEAAAKADTVAIVVKPQDMADAARRDRAVAPPGQLLVSLAAGITTAFIESRVPEGVAVVRVMPNTPALVDEGMAAVSPGSHCSEEQLAEAESLMASVGRVLRIPERQQDAVTAISGSGPAYIFFVVESMIEAGVHLGLPRTTATELVIQTLVGSAKMLRETGTHPTVLREQVTSPGGTTASALRELEVHRVRAAFLAAMEAARDRSPRAGRGQLNAVVWGATPDEAARPYPADDLVPAGLRLTRAIGVRAPAATTWRWLCQIAVAPYSYDLVDNLGRRSPQQLTPGADRLELGQTMAVVFRLTSYDDGHSWTALASPRGAAAVRPGRDDLRGRAGRGRLPDRLPGRGRLVGPGRARARVGRPGDDAPPAAQPEAAG